MKNKLRNKLRKHIILETLTEVSSFLNSANI